MITNAQLKNLTEFLDELAALSERTGIAITADRDRPFLDMGDTGVWLAAGTDGQGRPTYDIDTDDNR